MRQLTTAAGALSREVRIFQADIVFRSLAAINPTLQAGLPREPARAYCTFSQSMSSGTSGSSAGCCG